MIRISHLCSAVIIAAISVLTCPAVFADQNWDGDDGAGNFGINNNWYFNSQPAWGFSNGSLHFSQRNNSSQTSLYYDYGFWVDTNNIYFDSTFSQSTPLNGNGNGINFATRIENDSSFYQEINIPTSGGKNGSGDIQLNPVNADLTINGSLSNDNGVSYDIFGNNGKTLRINTTLGGTSGVVFTLQQNSNVIFGANQSYQGGTNIFGGSLTLGAGGTTGSAGSGTISIGNGLTLGFNRSDSPTFSNNISLLGTSGQKGYLSVASSTTATVTGAITSSGAEFWKSGSGTLIVAPNSGSSGRSSSNVITDGTLSISDFSTSTLGSGNFYIQSATLSYSGSTTSTARIGNSALQSGSSGIAVTSSSSTLTLSQDLGGSSGGGLTKTGAGTLALSTTNTYNGATAVNGGKLLVSGSTSSSSAVTVTGSGSILGGTGTVNGTVSVGSGAAILGGTGLAASGSLKVSNNLTLNSGSIIELALGASGAHSTLARTGGSWAFASTQQFTFVDLGAQTGTYDNIITNLASNPLTSSTFTITNSGWAGTFSWDGANIDLNLTAVPEPSTWAAGILAVGAIGFSQRRQFSRLLRLT